MELLHLSAHLYVLTKKYYRKNKEVHSLKASVEKYTHKFHSAVSVKDKQNYHNKIQKFANQYREAIEEKHKLMSKMNSFCAGFARTLQQEGKEK